MRAAYPTTPPSGRRPPLVGGVLAAALAGLAWAGLAWGGEVPLEVASGGPTDAVLAAEGLRVEVVAGSSDGEALATRALVGETLATLPPRWRGHAATLRLEWSGALPADVHGRIRGDRIALSRELLAGLMAEGGAAGPEPDDNGGSFARRAAMRALVHELAHAWDREQGLSRDPRLLDLAGWQVRPLWPGRSSRNPFGARSPDAYELHSPAEFVAVNLEHFLLDPAYACRRPALHAHFAAHFDWDPRAPDAAECPSTLPYVDAAALADADAAPLLELDPARVYAVDYLLAGEGASAMSRWGHSMLRLVVCAPGRVPGSDCRLDLDHHRVLSFRAFVDDLQLSSWRGLTGGYPSRLFVLPLQQVIDEYTRVELRPLDSIPLDLTRGEVAALLEHAARVHWSYDGTYRFIGNNCAVETWKLLHGGVPRAADAGLAGITPKGLLRRLRRAGLVDDAQVPSGAAEALRLGYRFEPWSTHYQALYDTVRADLALGPADVGDWLRMSPLARAPWLQRADMRASAALLLLEQAALRRGEHQARDVLKRLAFRADAAAPTAGALPALLADALREGGVLASPAELLSVPGYGLPQAAEREQARAGAGERAARLRGLDARLHVLARQELPQDLRATLEQIEANLATLGARLRELQRAGRSPTL